LNVDSRLNRTLFVLNCVSPKSVDAGRLTRPHARANPIMLRRVLRVARPGRRGIDNSDRGGARAEPGHLRYAADPCRAAGGGRPHFSPTRCASAARCWAGRLPPPPSGPHHGRRPDAPPAPNLVARDFAAPVPARLWIGDSTYRATAEGWLYLAVLLDAHSRRVVGWALADHLRTELALDALAMAVRARRPTPGLVDRSDCGCQYTATDDQARLAARGLNCSLRRSGQCLDNALAERCFATRKFERTAMRRWPTRAAARTAISAWLEVFSNRQRRHAALAHRPPPLSRRNGCCCPIAPPSRNPSP